MTTETKTFTNDELAQYDAYEAVRAEGDYNMVSRAAREATGLSTDEYIFVMKNFSELRKQFDARKK
jgi:hypothetical protein